VPSERDQRVLNLLLEHPYLNDGLTAEGAYHYLLGRTHSERKQEVWRRSARALSFWMKKNGFDVVRNSQVNRYFWPTESSDAHGEPSL
jgi:hypothetical protein